MIVGKKSDFLGGGHIDLSNGEPIYAAGEVKVVSGKIKYIDNSSGHYLPIGPNAKIMAETAFKKLGFNIEGKYIEKTWVSDTKLPRGGAWRKKL